MSKAAMLTLKYTVSLNVRGLGSRLRNKYWEENDKNEIKMRTAGIVRILPLKRAISTSCANGTGQQNCSTVKRNEVHDGG